MKRIPFSRRDFVKAVIEKSSEFMTYREAFECVNSEFKQLTGVPRYASYESFRVAKHREQTRYLRVQMPTLFEGLND